MHTRPATFIRGDWRGANSLFVYVVISAALQSTPAAVGQSVQSDSSLRTAIQMQVKSTVSPPPEPAEPFVSLAQLIPIPLVYSKDEVIAALDLLDTIPTTDGPTFENASSIQSALDTLRPTIQLGKLVLNAKDRAELQQQMQFLYEGGDIAKPTSGYTKYLDFEKRDRALQEARKSATPAERANLDAQITSLEEQWEIFANKSRYVSALNIVAKFDTSSDKELLTDWVELSKTTPLSRAKPIWNAIGAAQGWLTVTHSVEAGEAGWSILVGKEADRGFRSIGVVRKVSVSLRVNKIESLHPALRHSFFRNRHWRSKKFIVSDGDRKANSESELIPRAVSAVILIKDLQLVIPSDDEWMLIAKAIADPTITTVMLGDLVLKAQSLSAYVCPSYISIANPTICAVTIVNLPRIPDPQEPLDW